MASSSIYFEFSSSLNYFLKAGFRGQIIELPFRENQTYKHLIESLGVPHTEVGDIRVKDRIVGLSEISQPGNHIYVLSITEGLENRKITGETRFVLDIHLGTLTRYLRILGFDCEYDRSYDDATLALISSNENRILLTRDRRLLMRSIVQNGLCLRSLEPVIQLGEVLERFSLFDAIHPFGRCTVCNHPLINVSKAMIIDELEPLTRQYFNDFKLCQACDRIYWKGSHITKIMDKLRLFLGEFPW
jgi:uncharacterized protein